jgi:uncharacterized protein (DUF427 family)
VARDSRLPRSDERILANAAEPCHRIDIRRRSRHPVVRQDDQLVAEIHVLLVLDESGVEEPATSAEA